MLPAAPAPLFYGHGRQSAEPAERSLAVVLIQHLNKRADADDAIARIADSQAFPQVARSVLLWGPDPSDPEGYHGSTKVLTRAKGNAALAVGAAPVAADPGGPWPNLPGAAQLPQSAARRGGGWDRGDRPRWGAFVRGDRWSVVRRGIPAGVAERRPQAELSHGRLDASEDWPPSEFKR
jgi:hypothetical protein